MIVRNFALQHLNFNWAGLSLTLAALLHGATSDPLIQIPPHIQALELSTPKPVTVAQMQEFKQDFVDVDFNKDDQMDAQEGGISDVELFQFFLDSDTDRSGDVSLQEYVDYAAMGDPVGILPAIPPAGDSYVLMSKKVVTKKKAQPPGVPGLSLNGDSGVSVPNKARVAQQQRVLETVGKHDGDHKLYSPRTDGFIQQLTGVLDFYQFSAADIASLVRKCHYDETQIQIAVANIIEDRANHEQEQWGTVKKKKQVKEEKKMKEAAQKKIEEMQQKDDEEPIGDEPRLVIEEVLIGQEPDEWSTVKKKKQVKEEKKFKEDQEKKIKEDEEKAKKERQDRLLKEELEKQKKQNNERMPSEGNSVQGQAGKGVGKGGKNGSKNGNLTPAGKGSPALKPSEPPINGTKEKLEKEGAVLPDTAVLPTTPPGDAETEQVTKKPSPTLQPPQNHTTPASPVLPAAAPATSPAPAATSAPATAPAPVSTPAAAPAPTPTPALVPPRPKGGSVWNKPPAFVDTQSSEPTPAESNRNAKSQPAPKPKAESKEASSAAAAPARNKPPNSNHDGTRHNDGRGKGQVKTGSQNQENGSNANGSAGSNGNSKPKAGARPKPQGGQEKEEWKDKKDEWWDQNDSKWNGRWDWKNWNDWDGNAEGDKGDKGDWWGDWKKGGWWQKKKDDSQGWQRKEKSEAAPGEKPDAASDA
eukprot:symbB.v1.2.005419.t1/scaffold316.1/size230253/34